MIRTSKVLVTTFVLALFSVNMSSAKVEIGDKAPDFKAIGVDGKQYSVKTALAGKDTKATVICFTCNGCPVARAYQDRFVAFNKKYGKKGVKFIALNVNANENLEAMKKLVEEEDLNFVYAYDESGDSCRAYGARTTPHLFVVDGTGQIAYQGAFDDDMVKPTKHYVVSVVNALLAGKKPELTKTEPFGCGIKPRQPSQ